MHLSLQVGRRLAEYWCKDYKEPAEDLEDKAARLHELEAHVSGAGNWVHGLVRGWYRLLLWAQACSSKLRRQAGHCGWCQGRPTVSPAKQRWRACCYVL